MKTGIALGSNLGDRAALMEAGFAFLQELSADGQIRRSALMETVPVDCTPGSGPFLNAVAEIEYTGSPRYLLQQLQSFECQLGRPAVRPINSPRPLDLDILYFGEVRLNSPDLVIPHPRLTEREFVLKPLTEICPDRILPGQTETVRELLKKLAATS